MEQKFSSYTSFSEKSQRPDQIGVNYCEQSFLILSHRAFVKFSLSRSFQFYDRVIGVSK